MFEERRDTPGKTCIRRNKSNAFAGRFERFPHEEGDGFGLFGFGVGLDQGEAFKPLFGEGFGR